MKAHFKYSFKAGMSGRLPAFAVIMVMNLAFIILGSLGLLPLAAQITAVSLSGTAVGVMVAFNIVGDASILRRLFAAPGAYFYALTPAPRWKSLLSSVLSISLMDVVTMVSVIVSVTVLSFNLAGSYVELDVWGIMQANMVQPQYILLSIVLSVAAYLFFLTTIIFCVTVRKSVLYNKPAGGLLSVILGFAVFYVSSLSYMLLFPFGSVSSYGMLFFNITIGYAGMGMFALLMFIHAAILFVLTLRLLERRVNI